MAREYAETVGLPPFERPDREQQFYAALDFTFSIHLAVLRNAIPLDGVSEDVIARKLRRLAVAYLDLADRFTEQQEEGKRIRARNLRETALRRWREYGIPLPPKYRRRQQKAAKHTGRSITVQGRLL